MDPPPRLPQPQAGRDASRAERFEDEKRRIIDSCFSRTDPDGSLQETYITHIRITEYATHTSSPPPPEAQNRQNEKPRVIIVAVRKSGRVRMHKSKENANGTFSIGKTWYLDDLTAIESFTAPNIPPDRRQIAGDSGFIVTIGKSYFWKAQTEKEKRFFIASLVKIFGKYTGGRMPELLGFEPREYDQIVAPAARRALQAAQAARPPPVPDIAQRNVSVSSTSSVPGGGNAQSPAQSSPQSISPSFQQAIPPQFGKPSAFRQPRPPNGVSSSPVGSIDSGRTGNSSFDSGRGPPPREQPPREASTLRRMASSNKSLDSVAGSIARSDDGSVAPLPSNRRNGPPDSGGMGRFGESIEPPAAPKAEPPPERRRPPMDPARPQNSQDKDLVPAPLLAAGQRKEPSVPPRNTDRVSPRKGSSADLRSELGSSKEKIASPLSSVINESSPKIAPLQDQSPVPSPARFVSPPSKPEPKPELPDEPKSSEEARPKLTLASVLRKAVEVAKANGEVGSASQTPPNEPKTQGSAESPVDSPVDDENRPGLGPMIKQKSKGDIAGAFWRAATAAGVFKPRPGGALDQLRKAQSKGDGPDGITSVVPAPPRPSSSSNNEDNRTSIPEVKITVPDSNKLGNVPAPEEPPEADKRRSIIVGNDNKYLQALGVDTTILDKRGKDFTHWLDYFGWVPGEPMRRVNLDDVKLEADRELNKAQAGGWVIRFQEQDERVDAIKKGLDVAIAECDELDNLLTLYSVELSTLQDDIAYIEAQGQGLQVQAANQKTLLKELDSLLDTCAISSRDLQALRMAPLETHDGINEIEQALVTLFKAVRKIDPTMGMADPGADDGNGEQDIGFNSDYGKMRIVREKKAMYMEESGTFLRRLIEFLTRRIQEAYNETRRSLQDALSKKADPQNHEGGRDMLWQYGPLLFYAKEVDPNAWNRALQIYQDLSQPVYKNEFRDAMEAWKRYVRRLTGDEAEILFTSQHEKQHEGGLATTARRLTVKRSQNLARSLRGDGGSKTNLDKTSADSTSQPYEIFGGIVDDLLPMVEMEQNFIIDFFHATTLDPIEFPDLVARAPPSNRRGDDLRRHRLMEPDRELARRVTRAMETVFAFLEQDLQGCVDWVLSQDPLQGVGVLAILERKQNETSQSNQDFLHNLLGKLNTNLEAKLSRFVDEQVRAIEDTKVKINKRKGVISFVRVFPAFSAAVENMMMTAGGGEGQSTLAPNARRTVDAAYDRIIKTMFDSLKVIARENPGAAGLAAAGGFVRDGDHEDKEALNYDILLIENMNHYLEEVDVHGLDVLQEWKEAAAAEMAEHMELYLKSIIRRPLGKLMEMLENIETQLGPGGKSPAMVAAQPSNSKQQFNKVMGAYDGREIKKGVETLRKRVEKHFGEGDEASLSRGLVMKVFRECERFYGDIEARIGRVTTEVYGGDVLFEWPRSEVRAAFQGAGVR